MLFRLMPAFGSICFRLMARNPRVRPRPSVALGILSQGAALEHGVAAGDLWQINSCLISSQQTLDVGPLSARNPRPVDAKSRCCSNSVQAPIPLQVLPVTCKAKTTCDLFFHEASFSYSPISLPRGLCTACSLSFCSTRKVLFLSLSSLCANTIFPR